MLECWDRSVPCEGSCIWMAVMTPMDTIEVEAIFVDGVQVVVAGAMEVPGRASWCSHTCRAAAGPWPITVLRSELFSRVLIYSQTMRMPATLVPSVICFLIFPLLSTSTPTIHAPLSSQWRLHELLATPFRPPYEEMPSRKSSPRPSPDHWHPRPSRTTSPNPQPSKMD